MADRGMDLATKAEVAKKSITLYDLLEVILTDKTTGADVPVRLTNAGWNAFHGGNEYASIGALLGISAINETASIQTNEISVGFSGIKEDRISLFHDNLFIDKPLSIHRQLWSEETGVVGTFMVFSGRLVSVDVEPSDGELVVRARAANQFVDFHAIKGRRTNEGSHQRFFPGDRFFEYAREVLRQIPFRAHDPNLVPRPPRPPIPQDRRAPGTDLPRNGQDAADHPDQGDPPGSGTPNPHEG